MTDAETKAEVAGLRHKVSNLSTVLWALFAAILGGGSLTSCINYNQLNGLRMELSAKIDDLDDDRDTLKHESKDYSEQLSSMDKKLGSMDKNQESIQSQISTIASKITALEKPDAVVAGKIAALETVLKRVDLWTVETSKLLESVQEKNEAMFVSLAETQRTVAQQSMVVQKLATELPLRNSRLVPKPVTQTISIADAANPDAKELPLVFRMGVDSDVNPNTVLAVVASVDEMERPAPDWSNEIAILGRFSKEDKRVYIQIFAQPSSAAAKQVTEFFVLNKGSLDVKATLLIDAN